MDPFLQFLRTELPTGDTIGKDVTVTTCTDIDEEGKPVYDETSHTLLAQIDLMKGTEKIIDDMILKPGDAMGYFQNKDIEYLTEESKAEVTINWVDFTFKVMNVLPDIINIVVPMKQGF
jgi:hypothetical protein